MDKRTKVGLLIGVLAVAAYIAWKLWQGKQAGQSASDNTNGASTSGTGSNLNSVAPELVAGATAGGTNAAPGAVIPVNVTVEQEAPAPSSQVPMQGVTAVTPVSLNAQTQWAGAFPGTFGNDTPVSPQIAGGTSQAGS